MSNELVEKKAKIENLYLDPNNPRFADITNRPLMIPSHKITEQSVQEAALQRILEDRFEVKQLKDSILGMGFLQVDRLVVTPLPGENEKFLVIEGNRRLAAVKDLMRDRASGEIDIPEGVVQFIYTAGGWEDIGYEVVSGSFRPGQQLTIRRPQANSPHILEKLVGYKDLVHCEVFSDRSSELAWVADQILVNIQQDELSPEEILVITLDYNNSKTELWQLKQMLTERNIEAIRP